MKVWMARRQPRFPTLGGALARRRPAATRETAGLARHTPRLAQRPAQDELDLRVAAPQVIPRPPRDRVVDRRVQPEEDALALGHRGYVYREPAFTIGCVG